VALRGDRIARVGGLDDARAPVAIDATGLALAPGFIDVHTHDDFALVVRPEMDFKILGGVTTVVVGNCGFGAAPWPMARDGPHSTGPSCRMERLRATWRSSSASPRARRGGAVGHGTVRSKRYRQREARADAGELDAMKGSCVKARRARSALLGLLHELATADRLIALAAEMSGTGASTTHMRNEGQAAARRRAGDRDRRRAGCPQIPTTAPAAMLRARARIAA
jgi:hypothetical protein